MLSRFAYLGGQNLKNSMIKSQTKSAISISATVLSEGTPFTPATEKDTDLSKYPPEYPPATSKRDFINFPRLSIRDEPPPVRLGFIPESWFTFFYPKTGYTGPYMFMTSVGTYLFSKEIIVCDHNFAEISGFILFLMLVNYKLGPKISEFIQKSTNEDKELIDSVQESEKQNFRNNIEYMEGKKSMKDAVVEFTKARTEIVQLQMEIAYRERLAEVFKMVKNKLDCKAEVENMERRIAQKNLVDYVIRNVMKSITPDLEKNAMQACIADLNSLAAKA